MIYLRRLLHVKKRIVHHNINYRIAEGYLVFSSNFYSYYSPPYKICDKCYETLIAAPSTTCRSLQWPCPIQVYQHKWPFVRFLCTFCFSSNDCTWHDLISTLASSLHVGHWSDNNNQISVWCIMKSCLSKCSANSNFWELMETIKSAALLSIFCNTSILPKERLKLVWPFCLWTLLPAPNSSSNYSMNLIM